MGDADANAIAALNRERHRLILKDHLVFARSRGYAHRVLADRFNHAAVALHLPVLVFNVVAAVLSYFMDRQYGSELQYVVMGLTTLSVILSSIDNYLDYAKQSLRHQNASRQYELLVQTIAQYYHGPSEKLEDRCNKIYEQMQQIVVSPETPQLSVQIEDRACAAVHEQLRRMSVSATRRATVNAANVSELSEIKQQ